MRLRLGRTGVALALVALVVGSVPGTAAGSGTARARWNTRVFASVPSPGFPAYVFRHTNGRIYAATYHGPGAAPNRDRVFEWTPGGTLLRSWAVPGQKDVNEAGVQVANQDARGRLVLLESSTASVLTLDTRTGRFRRQAVIPDVPICTRSRTTGCSPNAKDAAPVPNYATWGPDGALYVSDYGQAVIWRIPATGGRPRIWFTSQQLDYLEFGTTGLVYQPGRHAFLVGQQTTSTSLQGRLYRLPVTASGKPGTLRTIWRSRAGELPDGFGVARSGRIYVANVGLSNQLVELSPEGRELARFPHTVSGNNGSPVPFDGPSSATFSGTRVLVANQSPIAGNAAHFVILDVEVGEPGAAAWIPRRSRLS